MCRFKGRHHTKQYHPSKPNFYNHRPFTATISQVGSWLVRVFGKPVVSLFTNIRHTNELLETIDNMQVCSGQYNPEYHKLIDRHMEILEVEVSMMILMAHFTMGLLELKLVLFSFQKLKCEVNIAQDSKHT